jgi:hypothetical protein
MSDDKKHEGEAKLRYALTPQEKIYQKNKKISKVASFVGYTTNILGLVLTALSPAITSIILGIGGYLIKRTGHSAKKKATLANIAILKNAGDEITATIDEEDKGLEKKRLDVLDVQTSKRPGYSPIGTEAWQSSYLLIAIISGAAQLTATILSSIALQSKNSGGEYRVAELTPEAVKWLVLALSILATILPDILNHLEEHNQEKRLTTYKWRLTTLQVMQRLTVKQTKQLAKDILEEHKKTGEAPASSAMPLADPPPTVTTGTTTGGTYVANNTTPDVTAVVVTSPIQPDTKTAPLLDPLPAHWQAFQNRSLAPLPNSSPPNSTPPTEPLANTQPSPH